MATTASNSMAIGTPAPRMALPDLVTGRIVQLEDLKNASALAVLFICRHCPYVVHVRDELVRIARQYRKRGAEFVAISSNDPEKYPEDAPQRLKEMAVECDFPFPMVFDESQEVARAFTAACTPDIFVFDANAALAYRGRLDDSTPGNGRPVTGADLRAALDAVLAGRPAPLPHHPSMGCSIKWK